MVTQYLTYAVAGSVSGLSLIAALSDIRTFRIPNWIPLSIAVIWICVFLTALIGGKSLLPFSWALLTAFIFFLPLLFMFARGLMGGGDVKLLAALSLFAGPQLILPFILAVALAGGVLAGVSCSKLKLQKTDSSATAAAAIPYGVAIATGGLFLMTVAKNPLLGF